MSGFPGVSPLIDGAFNIARQRYRKEYQNWVLSAYRLGGVLPNSLLVPNIQRAGELDLLLRCLEDETAIKMKNPSGDIDFAFHFQGTSSAMWISSCYEFLRVIRQRRTELGEELAQEFQSLFADFELLRMPLEKHEIAKDHKLKEPMVFGRSPAKGDGTDVYVYDPKDPQRAHIMTSGLSDRGSLMWQALDHRLGREYWIERRGLSERLLALL